MNLRTLTLAAGLVVAGGMIGLRAQNPPQAISYQAVARDAGGNLITTPLTVRMSIRQGSSTGTVVYQETHNVTPNTYGLFNLAIGQGASQSGSFSGIDWSAGPYFVQVELNNGSGYVDMGTQQMLSVPYALYAGKSDMALNDLTDVNTGGVTPGQVLKWNGTSWVPAADDNTTYTAGSGISISGTTISATDVSATNEIQTLSLSGNTLSISGGNSVTLPPGADNWGTQVVQTDTTLSGDGTSGNPLGIAQQGATTGQVLKWNGTSWVPAADDNTTYTAGSGISISGTTISATDVSATNEIQTLSLSGNTLSISGGNSVTLPPGADDWGTQVVQTDTTLSGDGTSGNPLGIAQQGATTGQVLKWNGSQWAPDTDLRDEFWQRDPFGNIYYLDKVGIGSAFPTSRLHVFAGLSSANPIGNTLLTLENSNHAYLSLLTPNGNERGILFGQPSNNVAGGIIYNNSATPNGLQFRTNGNATRMVIDGNGNVGIGTNTPQSRLHVQGNAYLTSGTTTLQILPGNLFGSAQANAATLEIPGNGTIGVWDNLSVTGNISTTNNLHVGGNQITVGGGTDPSYYRVQLAVVDAGGGNYFGFVEAKGANGNANASITTFTDYPNHGWMSVHDRNGTAQAMMYIYDDGNGWVVANAKFFRVPDPDDATRDIWYACIEGPEAAMYVRGIARLVNGRARIELPDHFRKLADEQGMTVQLTPRSAQSKGLAAVRVSLDGVEVAELMNGTGNYEFDWRVEAVRKEYRDFRVYRPWDEVMPAGQNPAQAWEARLKSIQDRRRHPASDRR